jgi:hypothetical protein
VLTGALPRKCKCSTTYILKVYLQLFQKEMGLWRHNITATLMEVTWTHSYISMVFEATKSHNLYAKDRYILASYNSRFIYQCLLQTDNSSRNFDKVSTYLAMKCLCNDEHISSGLKINQFDSLETLSITKYILCQRCSLRVRNFRRDDYLGMYSAWTKNKLIWFNRIGDAN